MDRASYRSGRRLLTLAVTAGLTLLGAAGCKKASDKEAAKGAIDPDERGKLRRIAANLEEAYARSPLPNLTEPASFAERLEKWDDFRSCTVRTYVARKVLADRRSREGTSVPTPHASIGDETVEECSVQLAVAGKDASICERLAVDYEGPNGEVPLPALRCWDTRARVFGLPDECPVLWQPGGVVGRNPECLAMARRDQSLCQFAESPGRCRALVTRDSASCGAMDSAPDCLLAFEYWKDLIPTGFGTPLVDPAPLREKPLAATFDLKWERNEERQIRVQAPKSVLGVSWPRAKPAPPASTEDTTKFWGAKLPLPAVQVAWDWSDPSLKLAFVPGGAPSGVRPLQPPSPTAAATVIAVWGSNPAKFRRCLPGPETAGELRYDAGAAKPGSVLEGSLRAEKLACSDGTQLTVHAQFRLMILDVR
jgi:hypothetical protein